MNLRQTILLAAGVFIVAVIYIIRTPETNISETPMNIEQALLDNDPAFIDEKRQAAVDIDAALANLEKAIKSLTELKEKANADSDEIEDSLLQLEKNKANLQEKKKQVRQASVTIWDKLKKETDSILHESAREPHDVFSR